MKGVFILDVLSKINLSADGLGKGIKKVSRVVAKLSESPRKNGWHLAEQAREARPYGMQRLLSQAVWDTNGVRDDLREHVLEHLGQEAAIVVIE
jgi:hypothetical protein